MKSKLINSVIRMTLFSATLVVGLTLAFLSDDTTGLASTDLREARIHAMAAGADQTRLYASATEGVQPTGFYLSTDEGRSWINLGSGPAVAINAMVVSPVDPQVIYAGTNGGSPETGTSLWRSFDGGQTWARHGLGLPLDANGLVPNVTALVIDRHDPDILYVGTEGQGLYRLDSNRGLTRLGGVDYAWLTVRDLKMDVTGDLYVLAVDGLFRVSGEVWTPLATPEIPVSLAIADSNPNVIYAGGASVGLFKSVDRGASWQAFNDAVPLTPGVALWITAIAVDPTNAARLQVATALGVGTTLAPGHIYRSLDGGQTWTPVAPAEGLVLHLATSDEGTLYVGSTHGLATVPGEQATTHFTWPALGTLNRLNGTQVLILALTLLVGGLTLVGRWEWVRLGIS